jgi:putative transcriptional regulator
MLWLPTGRCGVPSIRTLRLWLSLAAIVLPATLFAAAPSNPPGPLDRPTLTGQFLIASPDMGDPRFRETVIALLRHGPDGAFGLVINRPLSERPLTDLLDAIGEKGVNAEGRVRLFAGGPVQMEMGFVLHGPDYRGPATLEVVAGVALTANTEIFRDIATGKGPQKSLIAFGYAGWGPGQLEGEMARKAWFTAPIDPKLVFDEDRDRVWELAMERRTRDL